MTARWQSLELKRPDRYLDWEVQNRPAPQEWSVSERWCCALIQILLGPPDNPLANLELFSQNVNDGVLGPPLSAPFKIHADEKRHLFNVITNFNVPGTAPALDDDVRLSFFIYLAEDRAYQDGEFAHGGYFRFRFVGPPIPGLNFQKRKVDNASNIPIQRFDPQATVIGIIDDGIAFAHERFRAPGDNGEAGVQVSRIAAIWLQNMETADPDLDDGILFGQRFHGQKDGNNEGIDILFRQAAKFSGFIDDAEVYRLAGMRDFSNDRFEPTTLRVAHGTHVMDLACGADPNDEEAQADARQNPILAVQLPDTVTADTSGVNMGSYVLQGLRQIVLWADQWGDIPLVVNFSYGISAGPKDGSHYLEKEIARLVEDRRDRRGVPTAVVMPAGNSHDDRTTAKMILGHCGCEQLDWIMLPDDGTPSYVEIWFDIANVSELSPIEVTLTPPLGPAGSSAMPKPGHGTILTQSGKPICGVYYDVFPSLESKKGRVFLAVNPTKSWDADVPLAPCGHWTISIASRAQQPIEVNLYIQRDDTPAGFRRNGRQSYFDHPNAYERDPDTGDFNLLRKPDSITHKGGTPITHQGTLSAIGTGSKTVLVGAAEDGQRRRPARYTSSGPTPGKTGPDFSAIADEGPAFPGILAAGSTSGSVVAMRGTSVAAPQIARALVKHRANLDALGGKSENLGALDPHRLGSHLLPMRKPAIGHKRKYREHTGE